jgi:hypothetical protein
VNPPDSILIIMYSDIGSVEWRKVPYPNTMCWIWDTYEWLVQDMVVTDLADNYKVMVF